MQDTKFLYKELIATMAESFIPEMMMGGMLGLFDLHFPEGKITFSGKPTLQVLFGEEEETVTYRWAEYLKKCHPDDLSIVDGNRDGLFKREGSYNRRYRVLNAKTNMWRWVHSFGTVSFGECGNVIVRGGMLDVTEEAEHQTRIHDAQEAEQRANAILNSTPLGSFWLDENGIVTCNETAVKMGKFSSKQEMIDNYTDILPEYQPDGRRSVDVIAESRKRAVEDGSYTYEFLYVLRDGTELPVETTTSRVAWGDGYRLATYSRDLSDLKAQQAIAREAEEHTRVMLDATPFGCILMNKELQSIDCNETALKIWEMDSKEDLLHNYHDVFPETQPDGYNSEKRVYEMRQKALEEGVAQYNFTFRLRSGETMPVEVRVERVYWRGEPMLVGYIRDMRVEVAIAKKLEETQKLTQAVLDEVPIGCLIYDENNMVADCNGEAVRLFGGKDSGDVVSKIGGRYLPERQPDGRESASTFAEMVDIVAKTGAGRCFEWMYLQEDGEPLPTEVCVKLVCLNENNWRIVVYVRDLRELKRSMEEIERQKAELVEARDIAESSLQSKSIFLANMSHEIRTPITAIIGMTDIAKKSDDSERITYCLNKISDASEHLLGIINDILDFSKIEAGHFMISPSDFVVEKMLARISNIMAFRIDQKRQKFEIIIDKRVPQAIVADQQRLTQVIMNLLSNAYKFTPEGGRITLRISVADTPCEDPLHYNLRFDVTDNGIGIAESQMVRLFDSFEQGDNNISRRFGGTGLGLTISKAIVGQMGGEIWINSTLGEGSTFSFTIPTRRGITSTISRLDPRIDISNIDIMVVDDLPETLTYFESVTDGIGLSCRTASSAEECMRKLSEKPANIVFVDWLMPEVDGIELTRQIRRKCGESVVVIMISAIQWEEIETEATAAGVDRFIAKPLLPSSIIDCINECLGLVGMQVSEEKKREVEVQILSDKRILLAEDVEINREIVTELLAESGATIVYAENGLDACTIFAADPEGFDLILMDIQMPGVDGYTATERIRAMDIKLAKEVPIIAMTANVFKEDIERCIAVGMNGHIGKPIDYDEMMEILVANLVRR